MCNTCDIDESTYIRFKGMISEIIKIYLVSNVEGIGGRDITVQVDETAIYRGRIITILV